MSCSIRLAGLSLELVIASKADWLSVRITTSVGLIVLSRNPLSNSLMVLMIAIISAS